MTKNEFAKTDGRRRPLNAGSDLAQKGAVSASLLAFVVFVAAFVATSSLLAALPLLAQDDQEFLRNASPPVGQVQFQLPSLAESNRQTDDLVATTRGGKSVGSSITAPKEEDSSRRQDPAETSLKPARVSPAARASAAAAQAPAGPVLAPPHHPVREGLAEAR